MINYPLESTKKRIQFEPPTGELDINPYGEIYYPSIDFTRKFIRYDFADEWNNLGYGKISVDGSITSVSRVDIEESEFTEVISYIHGNQSKIVFCGIKESEGIATLWFNRPIGPTDGIDIFIIEDFILNYKNDEFGTIPLISEIPHGYDGAVTMRIDCDENIASGRRLFELYKKLDIPFSMAIKTSLDLEGENRKLIEDVIKAGGSVVSPSHSHSSNWGGSKSAAKKDASISLDRLKKVLPCEYPLDYVVSPFHQNPKYAIEGICEAGVKGFVGGIIKNDPQYLRGRASKIDDLSIFTHSQQCMLHGDCYKKTGLDIYKRSFVNHAKTDTFFGYLDHPFSDYKYGWDSEEQRLEAHRELVSFFKSYGNIWIPNLNDAMDFLHTKVNSRVIVKDRSVEVKRPQNAKSHLPFKVLWNKKVYSL